LARKPVNTEKYESVDGKTLVTELVETYGCIHGDFVGDLTALAGVDFENIVVSESSLATAIVMLAQVAQAELFVDRNGQLVASAYKLIASGTDETISEVQTRKADQMDSNEQGFSWVRVRGRYKGEEEEGSQSLFDASITESLPVKAYCFDALLATPDGTTAKDVFNATYVCNTAGYAVTPLGLFSTGGGKILMKVKVCKDPAGMLDAGSHTVALVVTGTQVKDIETNSVPNAISFPSAKGEFADMDAMMEDMVSPIGRGQVKSHRSLNSADEEEDNRIGAIVRDATLQAEMGIRWEEIDNPYISTAALATAVGTRRIVEFKQSRNRWDVDLVYDKDVQLNDKVSVTVPMSGATVVGVVTDLTVSYSAGTPSIAMRLGIEEPAA